MGGEQAVSRRGAEAGKTQWSGAEISGSAEVPEAGFRTQGSRGRVVHPPGAMTVSPPAAAAIESESLPPSQATPRAIIASLQSGVEGRGGKTSAKQEETRG